MTAFAGLQAGLTGLFASAPAPEARRRLLERCVLSASGLRFVCGDDEQSLSTQAPREAVEFVLCAAELHAKLMRAAGGHTVWLGMDTRPTGPQTHAH